MNPLMSIPGLGGYLGAQQIDQNAQANQMGQLNSLVRLQQLFKQMEVQETARRENKDLERTISGAATPEDAVKRLLGSGRLSGIELASKLKGLLPRPAEDRVVPPGSSIVGPNGEVRFTAPFKPANEAAPPEIVKLQNYLDGLPEGDPKRGPVAARIRMLTERAPGVQIHMPPSSDLVYDPESKQYGKFRIGKDGKSEFVPFQTASGSPLRPPPTAGEKKDGEDAAAGAATLESVRSRIQRMSSLIQQNPTAVGLAGAARRIGETGMGVVESLGGPSVPTPAIDLDNEKALLLADVRKLVEKDPNLSNQERATLYQTLGSGINQTPSSAIRALNNVMQYVESKKMSGPGREARIESEVKKAGWAFEPNKYEYRVVNGQVQRRAK